LVGECPQPWWRRRPCWRAGRPDAYRPNRRNGGPAGTLSVLAPAQPPVAIVRAPASGYWIVDDNGAARALGGAANLGRTANLALFTP
jgi:hypothetical protein